MKDNRYYVYAYIRKDTNTYFYIGKGTGNRMYDVYTSRNKHFKSILKKTEVKVYKIKDNLTEEQAYALEMFTIKLLVEKHDYSLEVKGIKPNKVKHLVNRSWGGPSNIGYKQTNKNKSKISKIMKNKVVSLETRKKLSEINKGKNHPNYGKHLSEETKNKISKANKGRLRTKDWLNKLSESHKGKISNNRKRVYCIELDIKFESCQHAIQYMKDEYNINCSHLNAVCNGKRKSAGKLSDGRKLHWKFIN